MNTRKVLVTGGAGCIGIPVCNWLNQLQIPVVCFDLEAQIDRTRRYLASNVEIKPGSILEPEQLSNAMDGCDKIIHLAGYLGVERTERNRQACLDTNILGTRNVLESAVKHNINKIVFASSSEVYGNSAAKNFCEQSGTLGSSVYAVSKLAGEELCKAYAQSHPGLAFTIIRYFNIYGSYQVRQFVVPKFIANLRQDRPPIIYGTGEQIRSFCYSEDAAKMTVASLLSEQSNGEIINIGNSQETISLQDLARLTIEVSGKSSYIQPELDPHFARADRNKEREIYRRTCETTKATKLLNIQATVRLKDGLRQLYENAVLFDNWHT